MQKDEGQSEVSHQRNETEKTTESRSSPYVFTSAEPLHTEKNTLFSKKSCTTKTIVILGVCAVLTAAIVTTGVLLGIFLYTDAQLEIIKFTKQRNENQYQDVIDDPNINIVQYHVRDFDQDAWVVNDFNRDIQTMKVQTKEITNCFVTALNRTIALSPSEIKGPESYNTNQSVWISYRYTNSPVSDTSFLHETAKKICKGVSVYWLFPQCEEASNQQQSTGKSQVSRRQADLGYKFTYVDRFTTWKCICWRNCCNK